MNNYQKVLRFADRKTADELEGYNTHIRERNEKARLTRIYENALSVMNSATTEAECKSAATSFKSISGFKDADELAEKCLEKAEVCRKDQIYKKANTCMLKDTISDYEEAVSIFKTIPGWKNADEQVIICEKKIQELKGKEEARRLAEAKAAEELRIKKLEKRKKALKIFVISASSVAVITIALVIVFVVIIPSAKYSKANVCIENCEYQEAVDILNTLGDYKDSPELVETCKKQMIYDEAVSLMNSGNYADAKKSFVSIPEFSDSNIKAEECSNIINEEIYARAVQKFEDGDFDGAASDFKLVKGYKDADEQAKKSPLYGKALAKLAGGEIEEARDAFAELGDYKDSFEFINQIDLFCEAKKLVLDKKIVEGFELLDQITMDINGIEDLRYAAKVCRDYSAIYRDNQGTELKILYEPTDVFNVLGEISLKIEGTVVYKGTIMFAEKGAYWFNVSYGDFERYVIKPVDKTDYMPDSGYELTYGRERTYSEDRLAFKADEIIWTKTLNLSSYIYK